MQQIVKIPANLVSSMTGNSAPSAAADCPAAKLPKNPIAPAVAHRIARRWVPWLFSLSPLATIVMPIIMANTENM